MTKMDNWKEQITEQMERGNMNDYDGIEYFISRILEEVIDDIEIIKHSETLNTVDTVQTERIKQKLKYKWLNP